MIELVEGRGVGAGKSYFVMTRLVELWRRGGTAYVTDKMEVLWPETKALVVKRYGLVLEDDQYRSLSSEKILRLHEHTAPGTDDNPVLIVLDEAQDDLNARDWSDKGKRDLFSWCCQSRHDDNDLIFISQSSANVDKQVRRLCTFIWHIRNSVKTPILGLGNLSSFIQVCTLGLNSGRYFICNQLDQDGRTIMSRQWLRHDKGIFGAYRSKAMRLSRKRGGDAVAKKNLQRVKGNTPVIKFAVPICLIALCVFAFKVWGRTHDTPKSEKHAVESKAAVEHVAGYKVIREKLLSRWPGALRTDEEDYETGQICSHGWVQAVSGNVAKIVTPEGEILFVVGGRKAFIDARSSGGILGAKPATK